MAEPADGSSNVRAVAALREEFGATYAKGATIVEEGESGRGISMVLSGRVVLQKGPHESAGQQRLRVAGPGETFGAATALAGAPHGATARALEAAEVLHVPAERAEELFRASPAVATAIAADLAARLVAAERENGGGVTPVSLPSGVDVYELAPKLAESKFERGVAEAFYDESVECPVCAAKFEATRVRTSALRTRKRDSDFRSIYEGLNPIHYAVYVCPQCRYAALDDHWSEVSEEALTALKTDSEERGSAVGPMEFVGRRQIETVEAAYLLALRCHDLRRTDERRRAGLLHRLAWLARERGDEETELRYLELTRASYLDAFQNDPRLREEAAATISYLLGDLSLRLDEPHEAIRWFSNTLEMARKSGHPEIERMTRNRWTDALEQYGGRRSAS